MIYIKIRSYAVLISMLLSGITGSTQQLPDTSYDPVISSKKYEQDDGPTIYIDRGHRNFHTRSNRYLPFAHILKKDGYQVADYDGTFTIDKLSDVDILVISNALHHDANPPFVRPTKSAFSTKEIKTLKKWVATGGNLFLIADHMPFAGAAADLASAFGFQFYDGFVFDKEGSGRIYFTKKEKMLRLSSIVDTHIDSIQTFTGQGFKIPQKATSILDLTKEQQVFMADTMWVFNDQTRKFSAEKLSQGAYMNFKKGKIVVFGEAAMFTAQLAGPQRRKIGMNAETAHQNYKLLLNIIHWLDD
ncbi:hypothetical protein HN014_18070 [Aquimarina sp. TRL1]|uniref:hypothetical protein n=1 Tax=Aquimarina sp. (strain TRL1) TaxID=2736252 RepID=UPI001588F5CA|nr:hypothetical protein [Aquimarina sp. TRL1]QKX06743.1 hypothetical protein HN014_18070 [Aquimarina sp. TRL1]